MKDFFKSAGKRARRRLLILLADILLINLAAFLALYLRFEFDFAAMSDSGFLASITKYAIINTVTTVVIFAAAQMYDSLWEFAGADELMRICIASALSALAQYAGMGFLQLAIPRSFPLLYALLLSAFCGGLRISYRMTRRLRISSRAPRSRTMLIGAGAAGAMALHEFRYSEHSQNRIICIIDDDPAKHGTRLMGVPVVGGRDSIRRAVKRYGIEEIVFAIPSATNKQKRELLELCGETGCKLRTLPAIYQLANGEVSINQIRSVEIEDLLGREVVSVDLQGIAGYIEGKTVLVTGGGGSIGSELCRQIATHKPAQLIIFDIYENNAYDIQLELRDRFPQLRLTVLIGSVRDRLRIESIMRQYRPEIVCHAAAHKHVPLMEDSPAEAIKNNIFGTLNTARAAGEYGAERFILISTDKAVNPTSVMGATKRVCEMIVSAMNALYQTKYSAVRFGNVLGSNGSVVPLFRRQIMNGGPVTVTHPEITRFFMTIPEAVSLVLQAGAYAGSGEVFVLDMGEPVRIDELARNMIRLSGFEPETDIPIVYTGLRPGEKLYEEILLAEEGMRKTANELIYIGRELAVDPAALETQLETLAAIDENDLDTVITALEGIVPGFRRTENV